MCGGQSLAPLSSAKKMMPSTIVSLYSSFVTGAPSLSTEVAATRISSSVQSSNFIGHPVLSNISYLIPNEQIDFFLNLSACITV